MLSIEELATAKAFVAPAIAAATLRDPTGKEVIDVEAECVGWSDLTKKDVVDLVTNTIVVTCFQIKFLSPKTRPIRLARQLLQVCVQDFLNDG
mmetsp:Transcript_4289/g.6601  ORF Transcript_4289/g.6601 Transcript_4289/m.6601 type:complete len:93 (+) Transcript_4289:25-303(+)